MQGKSVLSNWISAVTGFAVVILLAVSPGTAAAQLRCNAYVDRTSAAVGENVALTVTAEGPVTGSVNFHLPDMPSVIVTNTSYSRSQSITNGRSSVTIGKVFYLNVQSAGTLVINPVTVSDGKFSCETNPIEVTISARGSSAPKQSAAKPTTPETRAQSSGGNPGDDIFITLKTDVSSAWVGQQIILSFRYYYRVTPWSQPQFNPPRTAGFWREELGSQRDFRETVGGRAYDVTEIRYAIFPTHAGELIVEPAELSFPDQGLNRFFSNRRRQGPRTLRTDPVVIQVKKLPEEGQPDDFSGLVGSVVRLSASANMQTVPRGEPVDFKINLSSDAFLKGFDGFSPIELDVSECAVMHDAGENFRVILEKRRLVGEVTIDKVIVPNQEGTLELPRISLSWFDTRTGTYRVANAQQLSVNVTPSNHPFGEEKDSGFLRRNVSRLGQDMVFIHDVPAHLSMDRKVLIHSQLWWGGLFLPVLLLAFYRLMIIRKKSDPVLLLKQTAFKKALLVMDESGDENTQNLDRLARSITGFVADCKNRSRASVDAGDILDFSVKWDCSDDGSRLVEILESCDVARYGGIALAEEEQKLFLEVKTILGRLHKMVMKKEPGTGKNILSMLVVILVLSSFGTAGAQEAGDPVSLMAEGNQAYTQGNVNTATELYQEALELGVQDPDLFFNLGNSYARREELGRAVVNYLRAQQLAPRDQDIADNLAWVRGNTTDLELVDSEFPFFISHFMALVFAVSLGQWSWILLVLVWCLCASVAYKWRLESFPDGLRRTMLVVAALVLISAAIVFWRWRIEEVRQTAVVVVKEVAVRSGPDETFGVQFMVHDGLTVRIQEERQQWVRISLGGESLGWMPLASVEKVRQQE